jgi:hypothetical protein
MDEIQPPAVDEDFANRPGVPMEHEPRPMPGVHWTRPERQPPSPDVTRRAGLLSLPPVYSMAQPPHGLPGAIRRAAYKVPEYFVRHWLMLLLADKVEVMQFRARKTARRTGFAAAFGLLGFAAVRAIREA